MLLLPMEDVDPEPAPDLVTIGEAMRWIGRRLGVSRATLYAAGFAHALRARGGFTVEVRVASGGRRSGRFMVPQAAVDELIQDVIEGRPPVPPP
jgi:hypothetical protein